MIVTRERQKEVRLNYSNTSFLTHSRPLVTTHLPLPHKLPLLLTTALQEREPKAHWVSLAPTHLPCFAVLQEPLQVLETGEKKEGPQRLRSWVGISEVTVGGGAQTLCTPGGVICPRMFTPTE